MGYTLTKTIPTLVNVHEGAAHMVKITITSDDNVIYPPKILVMQSPLEVGKDPWFNCVASLVQLNDLPVDEPNPPVDGVQEPYFRIAELEIVTRSAAALVAFINRIETDMLELEADIDAYQTLIE